MATPTRRGKGRPTTPVVDRDTAVEAAIRLINESGVERFSVRRLSDELGITPPALYHHFADKDDILLAAAQRVLKDLPSPKQQATWQDSAVESMVLLRRALCANPGMVPILVSRPWKRYAHSRIDKSIRQMTAGGVPAHLRLLLIRATEALVFGSVLAGRSDQDAFGEVDAAHSALAEAIESDRWDDEEAFRVTCEALVVGFTAAMMNGRLATRALPQPSPAEQPGASQGRRPRG